MKIIIAPDSFKGTMTAAKVADIIAEEYRRIFPSADIIELPMADGGEGTTEAIISAVNGEKIICGVTGPLGETTKAEYGLINNGNTAVMEMASASGIELVPREKLNPMKATTYGTGEMIKDALLSGVTEIVIGIGGSATVDGGAGMAQALGYKLLDADGNDIPFGGDGLAKLVSIDDSHVMPELKKCKIRVACDVTNPLTGPDGAAVVYGPQKGATPEMVEKLEAGLDNFFKILQGKGMVANQEPGDGAAGGLGAALRAFCNAEITSGAELVCETVKLDKKLQGANLLITGEGKTDSQTLSGKLCAIISKHSQAAEVPVLLISGKLDIRDELFSMFDFAVSTSLGETSLDETLANAEIDLRFTAANCARMTGKQL